MPIRFVVFAFAGLVALFQDLSPRLPITMINGLHYFFEETKLPQESNPVWGAISINSGLCESLRFYGNFDFKYGFQGDDNVRDYAKDEGQDPIAKLVRILFPSTAGALGTETTSPSNFGNNISKDEAGVKFIANIIKFIDDLNLIHSMNLLADEKSFTPKKAGQIRAAVTNKIKNREDVFKAGNALLKSEAIDKIKNYYQNNIIKKASVNEVLEPIVEYFALENDIEIKSFYPKNILRQLIIGFFFEHFNSAKDLEAFVNEYAKLSFGQTSSFSVVKMTKEDWADVETNLNSKEVQNYEEAFQLLLFPNYFNSVTGYSESPVSNGTCNMWSLDQYNNLVEDKSKSFADCVETALRHLINVFCFDPETSSARFAHIKDQLLKEFLETYYDKDNFNRGDSKIRTAWNKVVSCRNGIVYRKSSRGNIQNDNEVDATLTNIVNMLAHFSGQPTVFIEEKQNYTEVEQEKIIEHLTKFGKMICGQIDVDENGEYVENKKETTTIESITISGNLVTFNIKKNGLRKKIEFNIYYKTHASISVEKDNNRIGSKKINLDKTQENFKEEINLLSGEKNELFYKIFGKKINGFQAMIGSLAVIKSEFSAGVVPEDFHNTCRMLVNSIDWQDAAARTHQDLGVFFLTRIENTSKQNYVLNIENIDQINKMSEILLENVENLRLKTSDDSQNQANMDDKAKKFLGKIKNLIIINITKLDSQIFPNLKKLYLYSSGITTLSGEFNNLEELNLSYCKNLQTIDGSSFPNLKKLNLSGSGITTFFGEFNNLEELDLSFCTNLQTINGSSFPNLKKLNLYSSGITKVTGEFNKIEELNLSECKILQTIDGNFPNLKTLHLSSSGITTIFGEFNKIEELNLYDCKNLQAIDGSSFPNLKTLRLPISGITTISGEFNNLEELYLSNCTKLRKISGQFSSLTRINLIGTPFAHITNEEVLQKLYSGEGIDLDNPESLNKKEESSGSEKSMFNQMANKIKKVFWR